MSRTFHLESLGGASGDMLLGVFIEFRESLEEFNHELRSLQVDPFRLWPMRWLLRDERNTSAR